MNGGSDAVDHNHAVSRRERVVQTLLPLHANLLHGHRPKHRAIRAPHCHPGLDGRRPHILRVGPHTGGRGHDEVVPRHAERCGRPGGGQALERGRHGGVFVREEEHLVSAGGAVLREGAHAVSSLEGVHTAGVAVSELHQSICRETRAPAGAAHNTPGTPGVATQSCHSRAAETKPASQCTAGLDSAELVSGHAQAAKRTAKLRQHSASGTAGGAALDLNDLGTTMTTTPPLFAVHREGRGHQIWAVGSQAAATHELVATGAGCSDPVATSDSTIDAVLGHAVVLAAERIHILLVGVPAANETVSVESLTVEDVGIALRSATAGNDCGSPRAGLDRDVVVDETTAPLAPIGGAVAEDVHVLAATVTTTLPAATDPPVGLDLIWGRDAVATTSNRLHANRAVALDPVTTVATDQGGLARDGDRRPTLSVILDVVVDIKRSLARDCVAGEVVHDIALERASLDVRCLPGGQAVVENLRGINLTIREGLEWGEVSVGPVLAQSDETVALLNVGPVGKTDDLANTTAILEGAETLPRRGVGEHNVSPSATTAGEPCWVGMAVDDDFRAAVGHGQEVRPSALVETERSGTARGARTNENPEPEGPISRRPLDSSLLGVAAAQRTVAQGTECKRVVRSHGRGRAERASEAIAPVSTRQASSTSRATRAPGTDGSWTSWGTRGPTDTIGTWRPWGAALTTTRTGVTGSTVVTVGTRRTGGSR
mmetsp:Transcript_36275/g.82672  ORF Transcript_36275/g.82672 Transcript_36275/m.82672 type:complete len:715 (+) Transcript_36275:324-2468(+)